MVRGPAELRRRASPCLCRRPAEVLYRERDRRRSHLPGLRQHRLAVPRPGRLRHAASEESRADFLRRGAWQSLLLCGRRGDLPGAVAGLRRSRGSKRGRAFERRFRARARGEGHGPHRRQPTLGLRAEPRTGWATDRFRGPRPRLLLVAGLHQRSPDPDPGRGGERSRGERPQDAATSPPDSRPRSGPTFASACSERAPDDGRRRSSARTVALPAGQLRPEAGSPTFRTTGACVTGRCIRASTSCSAATRVASSTTGSWPRVPSLRASPWASKALGRSPRSQGAP